MKNLNKSQRNALVSAIVASGTDDLNVMFLAFSMSTIISQLGISGAQAGWIATITNFGMLFGGIVFGILADRYSKFKVFKWTILVFSLATGLIFFTNNVYYLYVMRFLAGVGVGGEYGVAISIMAGLVPREKMGRISSLNGIVGQIGSITSAVLAGLIAPMFGWRGLFLFGLLPILIVLWVNFTVKEEELNIETYSEDDLTGKQGSIKDLFKDRKTAYQSFVLMIMTTVQIAGYFGMMNWLPTMMQQSIGVSLSGSTTWMISTIIGMCIGMFVFGQILDRVGPRLAYGTFLISSAVAVYLFTFANSAATMLIGGAIVGFFVNGMFAGYGAVITRLYPYQISAIANNTILNVGRAVGGFSSVIIGHLLDISGVPLVMLFLAGLYIISFGFMITLPQLKASTYREINHDPVMREDYETNVQHSEKLVKA